MSNTSEADLDLYINAALGKKAIDLILAKLILIFTLTLRLGKKRSI
jgi:hypothetical protein